MVGGTNGYLVFHQENQGLREVPEIPEEATVVKLSFNEISDIPPGVFSQLAECTRIYLFRNKLMGVRPDMWEGLTSLRGLWLNNNLISSLSPGVFSTLPSVTNVDLANNYIQVIQRDMFTGVQSLKGLSLSSNPISSIESGSFSDLQNLVKLSLSYTEINVITANMFNGLTSLERLFIGYNGLSDISGGTFVGMPKLNYLWLVGNKISVLRGDMWQGVSIISLFLKRNILQSINRDMWQNLETVELLELDSNPFQSTSLQMWDGLSNLKELRLTNFSAALYPANSFGNIASNTFTNLPNLTKLYLGLNRLHTLDANMFGSSHPENLDLTLSHNPLQCDSRLCWMKEAEDEGWLNVQDARCANLGGAPFHDLECGR